MAFTVEAIVPGTESLPDEYQPVPEDKWIVPKRKVAANVQPGEHDESDGDARAGPANVPGGGREVRIAHFFIDRPIFAAVISIVIVILGAIAYLSLPAAQYPDVVPPTIVVRASLSRRFARSHRRDGRHADRAGSQRRRRHALHVVAVHDRRRR